MLHERRLPNDVVQDLELVYRAKLRLLDWLLRTPPHMLDTCEPLVAFFGDALGKWLWARIRRPETRTAFGRAVIALANQARGAPAQAAAAADAIAYDAQFHNLWEVGGFELRFPRLHTDWRDSISDVALPFYDRLVDEGFEPEVFGLAGGKMDRTRVMNAFRKQWPIVCGYCDGPLGEKGSEFEANDCDHFFPKSEWPHLAIHPANLFSACKGCNSTWKSSGKPMGDADLQGLAGTYHPMFRPGAEHVVVSATAPTASARLVQISITDPSSPRRAETLDETLDLSARWTNWANEKLDQGISVFVAKSVRDRWRGWIPNADAIRELIEDDIAWMREHLGKQERCLRQIAVLEHHRDSLLHAIVADLA
jgi:hypothetical protein